MCWLQQSTQLWYWPTFLLIPLSILALVECFAGSWAWRFLLGLNGAVFGFVTGALLCAMFGAPMLAIVGALAGAVAGAALFAGNAKIGGFIFAFGSGASLTMVVAHSIGTGGTEIMFFSGCTGLAAAVASLKVWRPAITVITAVAGAHQVASAWRAYHFPRDSVPMLNATDMPELIAFLALAVAGLLVQFAGAWLAGAMKVPCADRAAESVS
jgi:hypothetical protein